MRSKIFNSEYGIRKIRIRRFFDSIQFIKAATRFDFQTHSIKSDLLVSFSCEATFAEAFEVFGRK